MHKRHRDVLGWVPYGIPATGRDNVQATFLPLPKRHKGTLQPIFNNKTTKKTQYQTNKENKEAVATQWKVLADLCESTLQWDHFFELLVDLCGKAKLKANLFPTKNHHRTRDEQKRILFATEDISDKELIKLRTIPNVSLYIPHPNTLRTWRKEHTKELWTMGTSETPSGVYIPAAPWCQRVFEKQPPAADQSNLFFCWTVDYAKLPKMTLSGWQHVTPALNQASSLNYHINVAYNGPECKAELERNCFHDIKLLNGGPFSLPTSTLPCYPHILVDFSCYEVLLGKSTTCFFCDVDSATPTCTCDVLSRETVSVKLFHTFPLTQNVRTFYPNSLISVELHQMKLDWLLHGRKAIMNNIQNFQIKVPLSCQE
jgi:hypothetical protein